MSYQYEHQDDDGFAMQHDASWMARCRAVAPEYYAVVDQTQGSGTPIEKPYTPVNLTMEDHKFLVACGIKGEWRF